MHRVKDHPGSCKAFHGHRYVAEITCLGRIKDDGMIVDFGVIKKKLGAWIEANWDHTAIFDRSDDDEAVRAIVKSNEKYAKPVYFLNSPPTAENLVIELSEVAQNLLQSEGIDIAEIELWETPNCKASWKHETR